MWWQFNAKLSNGKNDEGETNPEYDEDYSAQDAIDDIHDIVGSI